jgi:hypothetical protein
MTSHPHGKIQLTWQQSREHESNATVVLQRDTSDPAQPTNSTAVGTVPGHYAMKFEIVESSR